jgi:hypothetical protein
MQQENHTKEGTMRENRLDILAGKATFRMRITVLLLLGATATVWAQDPCIRPDNGTGTITLPPIGCDYVSPSEVFLIIDGLPPGTTIELDGPLTNYFCCGNACSICSLGLGPAQCETTGGTLGGNGHCFDADLDFQVTGTGDLAGFTRHIVVPVSVEVHTGPRNPGDPVQIFPANTFRLQGQLFGDPDFCTLQIIAGTDYGLPSPGQTTLTELGGGDFAVDSFFDITYQITFAGCPGSPLDGYSGTTTATIRMVTGGPLPTPTPTPTATPTGCVQPDNGTGTITLPPIGCDYVSPSEVFEIIDGLPPGTTIELDGPLTNYFCCGNACSVCSLGLGATQCEKAGGTLGGNGHCFDAELDFQVTGTGDLTGFNRHIVVPVSVEVHTGPRTPGDPVQVFTADMFRLQGQLFGDPDFCTLQITAGTDFGLPSPGQTTLTELPSGDFVVDSFFDITYQIQFEGCPGSQLDGYSGTTTATIRMEIGNPLPAPTPTPTPTSPPCVQPDNGSGTVTLPPIGCDYVSPSEVFMITEGLPLGTTIEMDGPLTDYLCCPTGCTSCSLALLPGQCEMPGGSLGGHGECFESTLDLTVTGTGDLEGFNRHLAVPVFCEVHTATRTAGDPVQTFAADMYRLEGELFGDPDFCTLQITGGTDFGLPSPGQTTLTELPSGDFAVDSFFDISYQIEFEGCPASMLDGYSGTTTGTIRMEVGNPIELPLSTGAGREVWETYR